MADEEIKTPKDFLPRFSFLQDKEEPVIEELPNEECYCAKHGRYIATVRKVDGEIQKSCCPACAEEVVQKRKKEQEAEWLKAKQEQEKEQQIEKCKSLEINPKFYFSNLSDYRANTEAQKAALKATKEIIERRSGNLVMIGTTGTGKTMLANIAARELGGKVIQLLKISCDIRKSYNSNSEKSEIDILEELVELPFLAIDEIGYTNNSDAIKSWLSYIIDGRYSEEKPTMLIGNLHFKRDCADGGCSECFESYFSNNMLSRLKDNSTFCEILAPDERVKNTKTKFITDRSKEHK